MKKIFFVVPFILALYACGDNSTVGTDKASEPEEVVSEEQPKNEVTYLASTAEWEIDNRLQEPAEDTICEICNMKVYTRDHELGVFSAQAVKADGTIAFYDDIGCLLSAEKAEHQSIEKFVRDYITLNWIDIEEATVVKTDMKSPMNWGYIFFAYEEDANTYISENPTAKIEELAVVKQAAQERHEKMMQEHGGSHGEGEDHEHNNENQDESEEHNGH
ncbi:nitrous oxide reductase accessory protein NosL [Metasolibacillus sp.]|uniref:nitrous oxide reductase accessory protein NosL n=1 Tax=Metasolibacillus sp. TaxID=2703680 RepID=UPI0025DD60C0|nr:nitrous oxide reductase accessory protein NosL [Metasolibacillus sp.]MCT6925430.1 nitrous oxide reductase accessory protein NosL [Metasolibacillus sp.]MCT6941543.1 nitrous oxide reductase accessory protein NosL [Metasolibacillus sp.]